MRVDIEHIEWLKEELARINRANLSDITFYKDDKIVEINPDNVDEFEFIGLNNTDFITSGYYKKELKDRKKEGLKWLEKLSKTTGIKTPKIGKNDHIPVDEWDGLDEDKF